MKYTYLLGGIIIESDIYFPELIQSDKKADVKILYGDVPLHLEKNNVDFPFIEANENQYLLKLEKIGRLIVENGTKITIQKDDSASAHDLEKYVLTNIFGALSYQRGITPMHGGVFIHKDKGILISGNSGNGKSALLTALYSKGYKLISDDISNLEIIDDKLFVHPSFPIILLGKDTADKLKIDLSTLPKLRSDMEKYMLTIDQKSFATPIELEKIIVLQNSEVDEKIVEIKGLGKIESIKRNTFKPWMVNSFGKQKIHFQELSKISKLVHLEVFQNNQNDGIEKLVNLFIEKLNSHVE